MTTSTELKRDVIEELEFDPSLDAAAIGVAVGEGVVTLNGRVPAYTHRMAAERAVKRVCGVRAVANELQVDLWPGSERDDTAIARAAVTALDWTLWVPTNAVKVTVDKGWVTLEGEVSWNFQREAAHKAVAHLTGVRGVTDLVTLKAVPAPEAVDRHIQSALQRSASVDARKIHVETLGGRVILRGTVRSWAEREDAERAAWSVAGVSRVDDEIVVGPAEYAEL